MILSNETIVNNVSSEVKKGLGEYLNFALKSISSAAQVGGSGVHDGYGGKYKTAINNWSDLIEADSKAVMSTHTAIGSLDKKLATQLLGTASNNSNGQLGRGVYNVN